MQKSCIKHLFLEKIDDIYEQQEKIVESFLNNAKGRTANKQTLISQLEGLKNKYKYDRDVIAVEKQIDGAIEALNKKFPDEIPLNILNNFKRTTYQNAYNKAGEKVLDSVEHDIGDIARLNIESASKGLTLNGKNISEINKEYGTIIKARKLLKIASTRKEIGVIGRLLVTSIGGAIGSVSGGFGTAVGMAAGQPVAHIIAGTAARSLISQGLSQFANMPAKQAEQAIMRILLPLLNRENQK